MQPRIGLILTNAPSVAWIATQLATAQADALVVIPAWGLDGGWTPETIAQTARLPRTLVVRTSWGDPSYAGGARRYPEAGPLVAELLPWLTARPDATIILGNEPLLADQADDMEAWRYNYHLERAITACRATFPQAQLVAPAHIRNHLIRLGPHADGQARWDAICAPQLQRCDALGLHAYSVTQATGGIAQLRQLVSATLPIWLTEFALNEPLGLSERGRRYRAVLATLPVATALLYHLDYAGGTDPAHFLPVYRLAPATLATLAAPAPPVPPSAPPAPPVPPSAPPTSPQRPPVASLPMSRAALTRGRARGPVQALVLHATAGRFPSDLAWLRQGGAPANPVSCHYYISKAGQISQLVADHDTAWHAGASRWGSLAVAGSLNAVSIGIELENRNTGSDPYPVAQIAAAVALARHLVHTYQIPRVNLVRHLDISPGRKTDPAGLDWGRFVAAVYGATP